MSQINRYENILETVGNTPLVKINRLAPDHVNLYVKPESFNPMGSVKDRLALGVIEAAERDGSLKPGQTVIEATSGNTGIGLAMVCAAKGYPLVVTMAESFSIERRKMMRFLGAKVVLTPAALKGTGMLSKAIELSEKHGWFLTRQFENNANADIHSNTTAVEILEAMGDDSLDYWVSGYGTGGTLKGVSRVLRQRSPNTQVVVCEPDNASLLGSGIRQNVDATGSPSESHPSFRPHVMQGWTPDFVSKLTTDAVDDGLIDKVIPISGDDAMRCSRDLAQKEGIFVGVSGGATFAGALEVCNDAEAGANIVCMLPDTGERYLSTPLFGEISEEMTAEELEISRSTPGGRFDAPPPPPKTDDEVETPAPVEVDDAAKKFFDNTIADKDQPVVLFALEWCEFCWSLRKLFADHGVDYLSVDLDSAKNQKENWGGRVRAALNQHTSVATIPQLFVGGKFIGGCTETFDAYRSGELQNALDHAGVQYDTSVNIDPYSLLPRWLQPR